MTDRDPKAITLQNMISQAADKMKQHVESTLHTIESAQDKTNQEVERLLQAFSKEVGQLSQDYTELKGILERLDVSKLIVSPRQKQQISNVYK